LHGNDPGVEYPDWLEAIIPTATVDVWAERGHYPHLVEPGRFVDRLVAFDEPLR
jgi:pimeloyl-ACP methyl ester carboxylesterase